MKRKEKGQSLLEMALLLPILLIVLMGVLDLGRAYYVTVALEDVAGEGAVYAALHPNDLNGIRDRAVSSSNGLVVVDASMIRVEYPPQIVPGASITVSVGYSFTIATPLVNGMVSNGVLQLRREASEPILTTH